ncbi:MAG: VCBS repeat-containing protein [Bacteroidota bacterium]
MKQGKTGIDFNNAITETDSFHVMSYEYIYNGAGVGIGDLNNDGLQDIIFAGNMVSSKVYLNTGNFKFKDITGNFEGLSNIQWNSSVTVADVNSDGWADIYFTSTAGNTPRDNKNRLWINSGVIDGKGPTFTEMAEEYGIEEDAQSVNAAFFDYDRDGDLDLYVMNNTVTQRMNTSYRVKITDGSAENNDKLYRNNGNGTFTDVTIEAGILIEGFGLGLAVGDVNKDGYPDIYVSNDYISNDILYINQGDGTFRNEIRKYLSYQTKSSMGNDLADVNNDGNTDIFTMDMLPQTYYKKKQTINGFSYIFYAYNYKYDYEHQYLRNMLHMHNGFIKDEMIPYSEVGQMAGIYHSEWSWSPLFADYDNDGDRDLLIANGYPMDMTDKDWTRLKAEVYGFISDEKYIIGMAPTLKVPNIAYENVGELNFKNSSKEWLPEIGTYSYGAAFADLDNDGDLDYITNNLNDEAFILKNTTMERSKGEAGYIKIKLSGKDGNTSALGAKVELWYNGKYQYAEQFLTRGYASSVDPVIHFGLGAETIVDSVKVTWPASGKISTLKNVEANQIIEINENTSGIHDKVASSTSPDDLLFEQREDILDYTHEQEDFIDFFLNQNIIPHKFSQIGPIMAKGDLDNDGQEDLIVGSTNKLPTSVFLRNGTGFKNAELNGLTTQKPFSESDIAVVDIDNDGDNDVIAIAGGYENRHEKEYQHFLYENQEGSFTAKPLPVPPFPASVIRPCDFNQDGNIDIFIGSRVKKGMFPYANHSWLITNNNGELTGSDDFKLNLGMVTDAVWSDYDNDGWKDLIITREWNSIVILKNMQGEKLEPQIIPGMEDKHGIWNSIVAGDFDQDGDEDYIAGNLGNNHRFTISNQYPLSLYALDIDLNGILDPITTGYWEDSSGVMTEYPINYLDELMAQSLALQNKFTTYTDFSYIGIDEILDEKTLKKLKFKLQVTTASSYILWNDNGNFRWEELPKPLQVSTINKMFVRDFNSDNIPDVLISGNDYTYDVATGYYDANKGFVLISKGKDQSFDILPASKSGILLNGMIQSLNIFEGDTSFVVAGINRKKSTVFRLSTD